MTKIKGATSLRYKEAVQIIKKLPGYKKLISVGSVCSKQPIVEDLDFITTIELDKLANVFMETYPKIWRDTSLGEKRFDYYPIIEGKKLVINIWHSEPNELNTFFFAYGYPRAFVIAMRRRAKEMGYMLNQYGIYKDGKKILIDSVEKIFDILDLPFRTPEQEYYKHHHNIKGEEI
jgi:DNA polymerase/3'-5' exonuclease PolX